MPYEDKSRYLDSPCILPIGDEENIFPERGGRAIVSMALVSRSGN